MCLVHSAIAERPLRQLFSTTVFGKTFSRNGVSVVDGTIAANYVIDPGSSDDLPSSGLGRIDGVNFLDQFWLNNLRVSDFSL